MKKKKSFPKLAVPKHGKKLKEIPVPKPRKIIVLEQPEKNWAKKLYERTYALLKEAIQKIKPRIKGINEKNQLLLNKAAEKIKQSNEFNKKQFRRFLNYSKKLDERMLAKIKKISSKKEKNYTIEKREKIVTKFNGINNLLSKIGVKKIPNEEKLQKLIKDTENNQKKFLKDLKERKYDINSEMAQKEIKKLALQTIQKLAANSKGKQRKALLEMQDEHRSFLKPR